jgi:anti-sigma factor RsiW
MLDYLANWRKSDEERRQETITAYLDGALAPKQKRLFEEQLASNQALRHDVEQQRHLKRSLTQIPRLRSPRNFTLDPALYGRPEPDTAGRVYPALRVATALAGIFFVVAVAAILLTPGQSGLQLIAMELQADEAAPNFAAAAVVESEGAAMEAPVEVAPSLDEGTLDLEAVEEAEPVMEAPVEEAIEKVIVEEAAEAEIQAYGDAKTMAEDESAMQEEAFSEEMQPDLGQAAPVPEAEELPPADAAGGGAGLSTGETETDAAESVPAGTAPLETRSVEPSEEALAGTDTAELPAEPAAGQDDALPSPLTLPRAATAVAQAQESVGATDDQTSMTVEGTGDSVRTSGVRATIPWLTVIVLILGLLVILLSAATLLLRRRL